MRNRNGADARQRMSLPARRGLRESGGALTEGGVRRVWVALDIGAPSASTEAFALSPNLDHSGYDLCRGHEYLVRFFRIGDLKGEAVPGDNSGVSDLTARFRIERGGLKYYAEFALAYGIRKLAVADQRFDLRIGGERIVSDKRSLCHPGKNTARGIVQPPAPFLAARALSFWDFMRESKPSSSTPRLASAATSFVISSGNPKVSYSLNASSPESVLPPSDFTAEIRCERMESPESIVCRNAPPRWR